MSDFHWYGAADRSYRGNDSYLGNSCWKQPYLADSIKKLGVQFRSPVPGYQNYTTFRRMWDNNPEHYTWTFTILRNGQVLQHFPTQAVTKSSTYGRDWRASRCLEANCVTVVFEGRLEILRYLCHPDGLPSGKGWFYCNYYNTPLYTNCTASKIKGCTCYEAGTTRFYGTPTTQAQINAAVALVEWLFFAAYGLGRPLENQNVWGAGGWGEAIFDLEPGPAPPLAIPWQWPVTGGSVQSTWASYNCSYWSCPIKGMAGSCYHRALDIAGLAVDTPVRPAAGNYQGRGSKVLALGWSADMGYYVRLSHSEPSDYEVHGLPRIDTVYCHLNVNPGSYLNVGRWVTMSDTIGYLGGTPSYDPHLHLGVYVFPDNAAYDAYSQCTTPYTVCEYRADPLQYLPSA